MHLTVLAVDSNIGVSAKEQVAWIKRGITIVRVDSMREAIKQLSSEPFFLTIINADNINYKPLISIMRDTSPTYIFIITSNYSADKQIEAYRLGADGYAGFQDNPDKDVEMVLALIDRYNERTERYERPVKVISFQDFSCYPQYRQLFYNDTEIRLTKKEFDLLYHFIQNRRQTLSHGQIIENVWGDEYVYNSSNVLSSMIRRLRQKLSIAPNAKNFIKTINQIGYKFDPG